MIVAFYSFKGGVGRSMALANVAEILADDGYNVVVCDWDLEAPGLEQYVARNPELAAKCRAWPGVVDLLDEYKQTLATPQDPAPEEDIPQSDQPKSEGGVSQTATSERSVEVAQGPEIGGDQDSNGIQADSQFTPVGKLRLRRPLSFAKTIDRRSGPGSIRLLTAGRRDGEALKQYVRLVQDFDWTDFYQDWAGGAYFEFFRKDFFRKDLPGAADILLLDARTGITEQGGVCTHHLADLVVLVTAANDLNLDGVRWMAQLLQNSELAKLRGGRPLEVLPVAARIDRDAQVREVSAFEAELYRKFEKYVPSAVGDAKGFLKQSRIPYVSFYSFKERVAAREPEGVRHTDLYDAYQYLATSIERWGRANALLGQPVVVELKVAEQAGSTAAQCALEHAWKSYCEAAAGSRASKEQLVNWRWRVLILTLSGALLGTSAETAGFLTSDGAVIRKALAGVSAILLGLAAYLARELLSGDRERRWVQTRSLAEALKSECYRFAVGASPYDSTSAPERLLAKANELADRGPSSARKQVSVEEARKRIPMIPMSWDLYVEKRINDQIAWYHGRAKELGYKLRRFRGASLFLGGIAALVPIVGEYWGVPSLSAWAAVITTATTSIASYVYAERFQYLQSSYSATARRLESVLAHWRVSDRTDTDLNRLVERTEEAISVENGAWMAELTREYSLKGQQSAPTAAANA